MVVTLTMLKNKRGVLPVCTLRNTRQKERERMLRKKSWEKMSALKKHPFYLIFFLLGSHSRCLIYPSSQSSTALPPLSIWGPTTTFSSPHSCTTPIFPPTSRKDNSADQFAGARSHTIWETEGCDTCRPSAHLACSGIEICLSRGGICVCMCTSLYIPPSTAFCCLVPQVALGSPVPMGETSLKNNACLTT